MPPVRRDTVQVDGKPVRVYIGVPEGEPRRVVILVAQHGPGVDGFRQVVLAKAGTQCRSNAPGFPPSRE